MKHCGLFIAITTLITLSQGKPTFRVQNPKPCCIPDRFTIQLSISSVAEAENGEPAATYGVYNYSYDATRNLIGMKGISYSLADQKQTNVWLIEDLSGKQGYTIDTNSNQCSKAPLAVEPFRCIPDSATYLYSSMYGYGNGQSKGDTWYIEDNNGVTFLTVSSDGNCIPMLSDTFGRNPPSKASLTASNYVSRINDQSVFNIPSTCNNNF